MRQWPVIVSLILVLVAAALLVGTSLRPRPVPAPQEIDEILRLQQLVAADPQAPQPRLHLAQAYREMGQVDRALIALRQITTLVPEDVPARVEIAEISYEKGWYEKALQQCKHCWLKGSIVNGKRVPPQREK